MGGALMKRIILYWLLIFVFLPSLAFSQNVTMDDFFQQVRKSHPFFKKEALSSDIERKKQERFLGDQDWIVRSNPYYAHEESAIKSGGFFPKEVDKASINAAIERTYWKTGGQLSFTYDYTKTDQGADDIVIPFNGLSATIPGGSGIFHENAFTATYSHPLIQNRGGILSRLSYEIQGYNVAANDLAVIENQENFLLDIGDLFLDWVLLTEQRSILYKRLDLAEEEWGRMRRKRKQNLVDEVDVIRTRDAVLNAKQNVLRAEASWKAKKAELATIAQYEKYDDLTPQYNLYSLVALPTVDDAIALLKQNSRVLDVFKVGIKQLEHQKRGFIEQSKPKLNFNISGGLKGGGEQYSDSYDYDKPQFLASLSFSYPLGNRTARADIAKSGLEKDRLSEDMKNVRLELVSRLRNLMTQIEELEKVLEINKEQVVVAIEKTKAELRRYNQGRIELTFVIQSRDNEQNVQLINAQNGAVYHKLILQYRALMDSLLKSSL
jgi:outer membrane protein TolC